MACSLARSDGGVGGGGLVGASLVGDGPVRAGLEQRLRRPGRGTTEDPTVADDGRRPEISKECGDVKMNSWQKTHEEEAQRSRKMQHGEVRR
jgi:hypothetical protein